MEVFNFLKVLHQIFLYSFGEFFLSASIKCTSVKGLDPIISRESCWLAITGNWKVSTEDNLRRNGMISDITVDASYFVGRRGRLLTICSFIVTSLHIFGITFKK